MKNLKRFFAFNFPFISINVFGKLDNGLQFEKIQRLVFSKCKKAHWSTVM